MEEAPSTERGAVVRGGVCEVRGRESEVVFATAFTLSNRVAARPWLEPEDRARIRRCSFAAFVDGYGVRIMIGLPSLQALDGAAGPRIWLAAESADMRCGFDRLAELAAH